MARYIDADALIGELHTQFFYDGRDRTRVYAKIQEQPTADVVDKARYDRLLENATIISEALNKYQTADVVERKKGKWKMTDAFPHWLYCDQCFKRIVPNANWIEEYNIPTNYCPNCGADMRERRDDAKLQSNIE